MYGGGDRKIGVFCGLGSRLTRKTGSGDERSVGTYNMLVYVLKLRQTKL